MWRVLLCVLDFAGIRIGRTGYRAGFEAVGLGQFRDGLTGTINKGVLFPLAHLIKVRERRMPGY